MTYFVSVTRLRLRSIRFVPLFAMDAFRSLGQIRRAPGFVGGSLLNDRRWAFWTLSVWDGQDSMRAYMTTGAHRTAMPKLLEWCDEASVAHWEQAEPEPPSWTEADRRMRQDGRPSKVKHPSPDHQTMAFAAPARGRPHRLDRVIPAIENIDPRRPENRSSPRSRGSRF